MVWRESDMSRNIFDNRLIFLLVYCPDFEILKCVLYRMTLGKLGKNISSAFTDVVSKGESDANCRACNFLLSICKGKMRESE